MIEVSPSPDQVPPIITLYSTDLTNSSSNELDLCYRVLPVSNYFIDQFKFLIMQLENFIGL